MIYSIKDLSDRQIEELRQCPSVTVDFDRHVAEVPLMAEGLFLSISKSDPSVPNVEIESKLKPDEALRPESEKIAYKIHSRILDYDLWIVATENELQGLVDEGVAYTIYTLEEVSRMIDEGVSKEGLKAIHKVKIAFPGSSIEDISKKS